MATNAAENTSHNSELSGVSDRIFWLIFALAALMGVVYNSVILVGYGPDETRHMGYIKLLFEERSLPFFLPDGSEYRDAHTLHPPLYYLALLPIYAVARFLPGDLMWHFVRLGSTVICLAALPLIYQIAMQAGCLLYTSPSPRD